MNRIVEQVESLRDLLRALHEHELDLIYVTVGSSHVDLQITRYRANATITNHDVLPLERVGLFVVLASLLTNVRDHTYDASCPRFAGERKGVSYHVYAPLY